MKRRGLSLAETVVALFVLVVACLGCVQMFHFGLRSGSVTEKRSVAAFLANKRLTQLQVWAKDPTHFSSWSGFPNGADADFPDYGLQTTVSDYTAFSPCSGVQGSTVRQLTKSLKRVQIDVSYPPFTAADHLKVVSLIGEPPHPLAGLTVLVDDSAISNPVPPAPFTQNLSAQVRDGSNTVIQDMMFDWYVDPDTGNGNIVPAADGKNASFSNEILTPLGSTPNTSGTSCSVEAWARYMGRPIGANSGAIHL